MDIRPLTERNLPLIIALAYRIWPVAYADVLTPAQIDNILMRIYDPENLTAEMAAGHRFWAVFDGDEALGFGSGYREDDVVWVKKLYVVPEAQGRGLGRALMDTIIDAFRPAVEARLLVNNRNEAAQAFYRRSGFVKVDEVPVRMGDYSFTDYVFAKSIC